VHVTVSFLDHSLQTKLLMYWTKII